MKKLLTTVFLFWAILTSTAFAANFSDFLPQENNSLLPETQYETVQANRLKYAKVLWVNWDLLAELGFEIPLGKNMTEEFESQILNTFAWGIISINDYQENFTQETITMFADYYGGTRTANNLGSGRAASLLGKIPVQIKGVGKTPLALERGKDHSSGKQPLPGAIREAVFGELNHAQLPFGANRILFIIDRGTSTNDNNGAPQRDSLVVRMDPIRPAHFMNRNTPFYLPSRTQKKLENLNNVAEPKTYLNAFFTTLGLDEPIKPNATKVLSALMIYVERIATQYARAYVGLKFYHGGTSASNIELNGRFLDYGTQTAQKGHGKVYIVKDMEPFGETNEIRQALVSHFMLELQKQLGISFQKSEIDNMEEYFDSVYTKKSNIEFLRLLGWPESVAIEIENTDDGRQLAEALKSFSNMGSKPYLGQFVDDRVAQTKYDFEKLIHGILQVHEQSKSLSQLILELNANEHFDELKQMVDLFNKLQITAKLISRENGIPDLQKFMQISSQMKNKPKPELYRWRMIPEDEKLIDEYLNTFNPDILQKEIDRRVRSNIFYVEDRVILEILKTSKESQCYKTLDLN